MVANGYNYDTNIIKQDDTTDQNMLLKDLSQQHVI
jgi:hypothetical protein